MTKQEIVEHLTKKVERAEANMEASIKINHISNSHWNTFVNGFKHAIEKIEEMEEE